MKLTNKKGFTLIEIVIVLAIAALILVIVFIAVAGAQRSQRNEGRRKLAGQYAAALDSVRANNAAITTAALDAQIANADRTINGVLYSSALGALAVGGSNCAVSGTVTVDTTANGAGVCTETATGGSYYRTH